MTQKHLQHSPGILDASFKVQGFACLRASSDNGPHELCVTTTTTYSFCEQLHHIAKDDARATETSLDFRSSTSTDWRGIWILKALAAQVAKDQSRAKFSLVHGHQHAFRGVYMAQ